MSNQFIREYLSFSRKERAGIFILSAVIVIAVSFPFLYPYFTYHKQYDHSEFEKDIAALKIKQPDSSQERKYSNRSFDDNNDYRDNYANFYEPSEKNYYLRTKAETFYFDPNTTSSDDWKRLGIRDKTIETIQKYLSKGGHFYKPEDISKIWGLRPGDAERLIPYVRIEGSQKQYAGENKGDLEKPVYSSPYKKALIQNVEINSADTSVFISLPGIGSKLAQRIINFRDKLGGFYSVDQLKETYGITDSEFTRIKPKLVVGNTPVKQININTASLDELKAHPYIRYNLANAIIQYKTQHGNFSSIEDIKKIMLITDEIYNKISPYLRTN